VVLLKLTKFERDAHIIYAILTDSLTESRPSTKMKVLGGKALKIFTIKIYFLYLVAYTFAPKHCMPSEKKKKKIPPGASFLVGALTKSMLVN